MIKVEFTVYTGEAYDSVIELVQISPGWELLWIDDLEAYSEGDPLAHMTVFFDIEQHATLFRLRISE